MKALTYNDVLKTIAEKYDTRSKRLVQKEIHVRALEYAIKRKIKALNSIHGFGSEHLAIDGAAFGRLYSFVKASEKETALKAEKKNKKSTASSEMFKALSTLLDKAGQCPGTEFFEQTVAMVESKKASLQSSYSSSHSMAFYAVPSLSEKLISMLFNVGVHPDDCISLINNIKETSKLYQFMNAICHVLLIIKAITSVDEDQGKVVARQLIDKVRASDGASAADVIFYALSACAKQLFSDEYERMRADSGCGAADKLSILLERKFFNQSLAKLIATDKSAFIAFIDAVLQASPDRLQALVAYFQDPNNIDVRLMNYSLNALTQQVNADEVTQPSSRMRF